MSCTAILLTVLMACLAIMQILTYVLVSITSTGPRAIWQPCACKHLTSFRYNSEI